MIRRVGEEVNAHQRVVLLYGVVLLGILLVPIPWTMAQPVPSVQSLSADLAADQRAHLWRVGAWGAANAAAGTALFLLADNEAQPGRRAFGMQSAAWGVINVGIAAIGLANGAEAPTEVWSDALAAENAYADILLVNLGLNVGYMAVGTTLLAVSGRGVPNPNAWRGHGSALVVQGLGLLVLDTVAYLGTRARMDDLVSLASSAAWTPLPDGLALVISL
ncbi:MAG: hypothetical protein Rubg2KO_14730 [Rubricoccaceae bacterium]